MFLLLLETCFEKNGKKDNKTRNGVLTDHLRFMGWRIFLAFPLFKKPSILINAKNKDENRKISAITFPLSCSPPLIIVFVFLSRYIMLSGKPVSFLNANNDCIPRSLQTAVTPDTVKIMKQFWYEEFEIPTQWYTKLCNSVDPFPRNCVSKSNFQYWKKYFGFEIKLSIIKIKFHCLHLFST